MSLLGGGCHSGLLGIAALFEHQTIKSNSKNNYSVLTSVMEKLHWFLHVQHSNIT